MLDVQEVFRMSTHKVEQDAGALERQFRRRDRKNRNRKVGAFAVAAVVGVAAAIVVVLAMEQRTTTEPAISPTTPTPPVHAVGAVPKTDYFLDLDTGKMTPLPKGIAGTEDRTSGYAVSPDGSKLAYVGRDDNGIKQIFVANLDGTQAEQVTDERYATSPAWSPDGSKIVYIGHGPVGPGKRPVRTRNVYLLDLASGESTQVTSVFRDGIAPPGLNDEVGSAASPSFTPDGASIVYSLDHAGLGDVRIVSITGGKSERLVGGDGMDARDGQLSPDGSLVSYACDNVVGNVGRRCLASSDGTDAGVLAERLSDTFPTARWSPDGTRIAYWRFESEDVAVVNVTTGQIVYVAEGAFPVWLDDHTLIVERHRCSPMDDPGAGFAHSCPAG